MQANPPAAQPAPALLPTAQPTPPVRRLDRRYVTAALMLVMVLASMEQTVTSTAMPTIIGDLHGLEHYSWVASIYLLACSVSMPLYGRLSDALGRKRVVLFSIGLFSLSSMLAAAAHSMIQLVIYRGLQGLGAGGIMPVVLTILGDIFTLKERAQIQGFFSAVWGTASLAGPLLGAFLVKYLGWRSIFFVNLPFGVLGMAVLMWKYHDVEKPHSTDLDLPGAGLLAAACICILALVSRLGPGGWSPPTDLALLASAAAALIGFILRERRAANPIMPMGLFTHRAIEPALIASFVLGAGFLSIDTYVPLYVQGGQGGGAMAAASVVTPVMLTWALSGIVAAPLLVRWGFKKTALLGSVVIAVGYVGLLLCAIYDLPRWAITGVLAITGFGFGPTSISYLIGVQEAVTWQQRGISTSAVTLFRTIGGAIGIGLLGALFTSLLQPQLPQLQAYGVSPDKLLDPHLLEKISPAVIAHIHRTITSSLLWVFAAILPFGLLQILMTLPMKEHKADHRITTAEAMESLG